MVEWWSSRKDYLDEKRGPKSYYGKIDVKTAPTGGERQVEGGSGRCGWSVGRGRCVTAGGVKRRPSRAGVVIGPPSSCRRPMVAMPTFCQFITSTRLVEMGWNGQNRMGKMDNQDNNPAS